MPRGKGIYDDENADETADATEDAGDTEHTPDVAPTDEEPTA